MTYRRHLEIIDQWFDLGVQAGRGAVLCRRGCAACCHGPFDISPADAELVVRTVRELEPVARARVERRASAQVARYAALLPDWNAPWNVDEVDESAFDRLTDQLGDLPCPALDETGGCVIYAGRPATCRMTGLPMKTAQGEQIDNVCPIVSTSEAFASLEAREFDLAAFEDGADAHDRGATRTGHVRTTVAAAIHARPAAP